MLDRMLLKKDMKEKTELVNIILDRFLPRKDEYPKEIHKAMRHTLFAGGKRLRPYLAILTHNLFKDKESETITLIASAIELLHTYTLVHDDLPEIDNDDYRRGKETCHLVYGPEIALLAGDALLVSAFHLLCYADIDDNLKRDLIADMAVTCGHSGLIAGQVVDIASEGKKGSKELLHYIHENKTAKLIKLAIRFGCKVASADNERTGIMETFGDKIGLAFQITDDVLDVEGSYKTLGKTVGKDSAVEKMTFPAIYGLEESKTKASELIQESLDLLEKFGERAKLLRLLTNFLMTRKF